MSSEPITVLDPCKNDQDFTKKCESNKENDMTAVQACEKEKTLMDNTFDYLNKFMDNFSPASIIKAFGASNENNTKVQSIVNTIQESTTVTDDTSKCFNDAKVFQQNVIGSEECGKLQNDTIKSLSQLTNGPEMVDKYLAGIQVNRVSQENDNNLSQQCVLQKYTNAVKKLDSSVESSALLKLLQSSKDLLASNKSNTNMCQVINSKQKACDYFKSTLCCSNKADISQFNILKCQGANDITQKNVNNQLQICNLTGSTTVDTGLASKAVIKSSVDISQKAVGTSAWAFFAFFLILFLVPVAPVVVGAKIVTKETKSGIPFLLLLVSFICLICSLIFGVLHLSMGKKEYTSTKENSPLYCNTDKCNSSSFGGDIAITYEKAFQKCLDMDNCVAIDFSHSKTDYVTDKNSNSSEPFNIYGTSVYYNDAQMCDEESCNSKNKTFTGYKRDDKYYFYGFIVSLLIFLGSLVLMKFVSNRS